MNISFALFAVIVLLIAALSMAKPRWLFVVHPALLLVLPTVRFAGPFPIYLFDVSGVALLLYVLKRGPAWPRTSLPWPTVLLAVLLFSACLVPTLRYGFNAPPLWVGGHAIIAFSAIVIGAYARARDPSAQRDIAFFSWSIAISLVVLAAIGIFCFGSPARTSLLNSFFYKDVSRSLLSDFLIAYSAQRVAGPFQQANIFGSVAVLSASAVWVLGNRKATRVAFVAAVIVALSSVSRQSLIGLALILSMLMLFSNRAKLWAIPAAILAPIFVVVGPQLPMIGSAVTRFARLDEGALGDSNVTARVIEGPKRFFALISEHPDVLFFGVGWDIHKLAASGVGVGVYASGAASNGFLLWLYYAGLAGLITIIWLLIDWTRRAYGEFRLSRTAAALCVVPAVAFLISADNASVLVEAFIFMFALMAGKATSFTAPVKTNGERVERRRRLFQ